MKEGQADPGFLERGFICVIRGGGAFCLFYLVFLKYPMTKLFHFHRLFKVGGGGGQWLSGRVLDSRPRGRRFEPHQWHFVVSLSKNIYSSLINLGIGRYNGTNNQERLG